MKLLLVLLLLKHDPTPTQPSWTLQVCGSKCGNVNVGRVPLSFNIPSSPSYSTYLTMPFSADLTAATQLVLTFQTASSGTPVYNANPTADNQYANCYYPSGYPAIVVPLLWRNGSLTSQFNRWWARDYRVDLQPNGSFQIVVPMNPANWMSIYGVFGDQAPLDFADALRNMYAVGVTLGGGCYLAHGVGMQSGTTTFSLGEFRFQ